MIISWKTLISSLIVAAPVASQERAPGSNPIIKDRFTADPAPLVHGNRLYLYVGHDEARGKEMSPCANGTLTRPMICAIGPSMARL